MPGMISDPFHGPDGQIYANEETYRAANGLPPLPENPLTTAGNKRLDELRTIVPNRFDQLNLNALTATAARAKEAAWAEFNKGNPSATPGWNTLKYSSANPTKAEIKKENERTSNLWFTESGRKNEFDKKWAAEHPAVAGMPGGGTNAEWLRTFADNEWKNSPVTPNAGWDLTNTGWRDYLGKGAGTGSNPTMRPGLPNYSDTAGSGSPAPAVPAVKANPYFATGSPFQAAKQAEPGWMKRFPTYGRS